MNPIQTIPHQIPHLSQHDKVILFDGVCRLCNGWSRFILTYDKQKTFKLASLQSSVGQDILSALGLATDQFDSIIYIENHQVYQKSEAVLTILSHLPFPWNGLSGFHIVPQGLRDWVYDRIASNRYALFGKYDQCKLPAPEHQDRFLEDFHSSSAH